MIIYSKIQTFRMYQTFGESIPGLIFSLVLYIGHPYVYGICRTFPKNDTIYSLKELVSLRPAKFLNPDQRCPQEFYNLDEVSLYLKFHIYAASEVFNVLFKLIFVAETYIYMPLYEVEDMSKKKMLPQSKLFHIFILPLMALTFFPRIE